MRLYIYIEDLYKSIKLQLCASYVCFLVLQVHCPKKVKVQPALLFSFFVHNSLINEFKSMKLSEHICYEMIN